MRRALVVAALWGCTPKVHLTVLEAADITVPADVRTLALVERSGAEGPGAASAVDGVASLLESSPRFAIARSNLGLDPGPEPLPPGAVAKVLAAAEAQAVLSLEAFAAESMVEVTSEEVAETVEGREVTRTVFTAARATKVEATWRLYDDDGTVIDHLAGAGTTDSWSATGATRELAEQALPPVRDAVGELAWGTGTSYGRRIAPWYADVVRDYFVRGDPRLADARRWVRAGDWKRAITTWSEVAAKGPSEIRARAEYDLAVAYEVKGQYRRALTHAEEAARLDPRRRIVRYRDVLRAELPERRMLQEQMEPVGGVP